MNVADNNFSPKSTIWKCLSYHPSVCGECTPEVYFVISFFYSSGHDIVYRTGVLRRRHLQVIRQAPTDIKNG